MSQLSDFQFEQMAHGIVAVLAYAPTDPIRAFQEMVDGPATATIVPRKSRKKQHPASFPSSRSLLARADQADVAGCLLLDMQRRAKLVLETHDLTRAQCLALMSPIWVLGIAGTRYDLPRAILTKLRVMREIHLGGVEYCHAFRRAILMGGLVALYPVETAVVVSELRSFESFKIEQLAALFRMPHKTLQRMAAVKKLPQCYRTNGGHWRVAMDERTCRWIVNVKCAQTAVELEAYFSEEWLSGAKTLVDLLKIGRGKCDVFDKPVQDPVRVAVHKAIRDVEVEAEPTIKAVARKLGISPATFKRRGFNHDLREWKTRSASTDFLEKDPLAKRLYKNQILQETDEEQ